MLEPMPPATTREKKTAPAPSDTVQITQQAMINELAAALTERLVPAIAERVVERLSEEMRL
jgi:hypothetical protein